MLKATDIRGLSVISSVAGLTALSVVLKLFEIPYPPAPFLKYDVSGIPLTLISFISLKYVFSALPAYYIIPVALGFDPVGMAMKCLAEVFTFTPLALVYRRMSSFSSTKMSSLVAVSLASASRVAVMLIANYIITPYWLLWAGWIKDLEIARAVVTMYLPHIALFNLTLALIVTSISMSTYVILRRSNFLK